MGDYAGARPELVALAAHPDKLSSAELLEVRDDLCTTDYTIGKPSFSLKDQYQTCSEAAAMAGSSSGPVLARITAEIADNDTQKVTSALKAGDLAGAEAAAEDYESLPENNQTLVRSWSDKMWLLVNSESKHHPHVRKAALANAVMALRHSNPKLASMSDEKFRDWIVTTATIDGVPMIENPPLSKHGVLKLKVAQQSLPIAALHLDRFATINDGVAARCRCDARTDIGIGPSRFPAYVARLDAENKRSEVLILLSGASIGPRLSSR